MKLSALLGALQPRTVSGGVEVECRGLAYDSRQVTPGILFFALPGSRVDGAKFSAQAAVNGAVAVVAESAAALPPTIPQIIVPNARQAMARVAAAFYGQPSRALRVIGITGTNGKTTVAFLVRHLLNSAGIRTGMLGTVEYDTGDRVIPASRTTPESLDLQQMFARMRDAGCDACVMEVSSHALCQHRVEEIQFHAGVFTNLTRDHLDYHGDMEKYFTAKRRLFEMLHPDRAPGTAIINVDDLYGQRLASTLSAEETTSFGLSDGSGLRGRIQQLGAQETHFHVANAGARAGEWDQQFPLIGRHNVSNALAAIGVGLAMGLDAKTIQCAMATAPPAPGRLEPVDCGQPFAVFVDYAHTDDALRQVLITLREITRGRLLLLFGCGGNRDAGKRPAMGEVAAELADITLVTNDNPRRESPETIAAQIVAGYHCGRSDGCEIELDRARAIEKILQQAQPGDTVLLAGKGHETYQEAGDAVAVFDDRQHATTVLAALGHGR